VLWRCWLGSRKGIRPVKTEWWGAGVVICLERGADLHMDQLIPLPLTVSCFSKIQIGFTFLERGPLMGCVCACVAYLHTHTHTHTFNGPFSETTQLSRYQKGKTNLDFTEGRDSEWQWHQLGHMQVCTLLQADNHTSTPPLSFFRPDALPAAQLTLSMHLRHV